MRLRWGRVRLADESESEDASKMEKTVRDIRMKLESKGTNVEIWLS